MSHVRDTSAGITGWAKYDGPGMYEPYVEPPIIPMTVAARDVARAKADRKKTIPARRRANFVMTPAGQEELMTMIEQRDAHLSSNQLGSLPYAAAAAQGLIQIELNADTGACDSVMPKPGPCAHIKIHPSAQSEAGMSYEVASSETIPNLGERRLSFWTEGAGPPRAWLSRSPTLTCFY